MPRKIDPRKLNVVNAIINNEIGLTSSPYRQSLRILHSLVKNKSTKFEKIWSETSHQPIIYEDGKIYFNNHSICKALCGKDSLPSTIYQLQKNTKVKRFEDVFIYSGPVYCTPLPRQDFKPYFLALTSDNWLIRYDNMNGKVLQEIYLGPVQRYSFRHVDWETQGETIVLQSTLFPGIPAPNAKRTRVVQAVAVFSIMPIKFIGLFEIDQAQFGKEVNTANISEGLLILGIGSSTNGKIRIYSLKEVLKESNRLFEATLDLKCDDLGGKVGQYPFGLPLNYKINSQSIPPILFEVRCGEPNLHFGGYPWHYVTNPPNTAGVFEVRNVETNKLAENGRFDLPNNTTEADTLTFHTDDSGRLIYESGNSVRFFKFSIQSNGNSFKTTLEQQFELKLLKKDEMINGNGINYMNGTTFSRQATKNISYVEKPERSILADDFENELEFYLLLGIDTQTNKKRNGRIMLYDNDTGKLVHEIKLGLTLDEMADYTLIMDLDTLIVTSKQVGANKFDCNIFRMSRDSDIDIERTEIPDLSEGEIESLAPRKKRRKRTRKFY